jgi:hypothetical protein
MQTNIERNGARGEDLVARILNAVKSMNKYDCTKDMTEPDGTLVEVKTQVPWYLKGAFTVDMSKVTNFRKCMSVDRLIFVEIPLSSNTIKIYECVNRSAGQEFERTRGDNRRMWGWFIKDMALLHSVNDPKLAASLRGDTKSTWRNNF